MSDSKKILFVTPHLPAPTTSQAGERFVFEIIRHLSERSEVHLVVRVHEDQLDAIEPVKAFCKAVYPVFCKRPKRQDIFAVPKVVLSYYRLCRMANAIAKKESFDVIHVEWTEAGLFLRKRGRMLINAHDVITKPMERRYRNSKGIRRLVNLILYQFTKRLECYIYRRFDVTLVRTEFDKNYLLSIDPYLDVSILTHPAGLDISDRRFEREEKSILFLGAMDRGPNIEAVLYFWKEILPLIREKVPDVKFYVVGSRPVHEVMELASKDRNTIVTGFVEDLEPYYKRAAVFVAPLLTGGGIIVKILDALAAGTPVVTTSIGNEGIGAAPGKHLLVGDTAEEIARNVIRLIEDERLRADLGQAGQDFIRKNYGYEKWVGQLEEGYSALPGKAA